MSKTTVMFEIDDAVLLALKRAASERQLSPADFMRLSLLKELTRRHSAQDLSDRSAS